MTWTSIPTAGAKLRGATLEDLLQELRPLYADVGTNQTMTANTTLQNVTDLVLALEANKRYTAYLHLMYTGGTTEDVKIGASWPTLSVVDFGGAAVHNAAAAGAFGDMEGIARVGATSGSTVVPASGGGGSGLTANIWFGITTGANAGNFQIMVANNAAGATAMVVLAGSWLEIRQAE